MRRVALLLVVHRGRLRRVVRTLAFTRKGGVIVHVVIPLSCAWNATAATRCSSSVCSPRGYAAFPPGGVALRTLTAVGSRLTGAVACAHGW
jgi:hypothetical protein